MGEMTFKHFLYKSKEKNIKNIYILQAFKARGAKWRGHYVSARVSIMEMMMMMVAIVVVLMMVSCLWFCDYDKRL